MKKEKKNKKKKKTPRSPANGVRANIQSKMIPFA